MRHSLFIVWVLENIHICHDVIRWEIIPYIEDELMIHKYGVNKTFHKCCEFGYIHILKNLYGKHNPTIPVLRSMLKICCEHEQYNTIACLLDSYFSNMMHITNSMINIIFVELCTERKMIAAKGLYEFSLSNNKINITRLQGGFIKACCSNGDISSGNTISERNSEMNDQNHYIFKWLYNQGKVSSRELRYCISVGCRMNYFHTVKELYIIICNNNIPFEPDNVVHVSCENGHLDILKYWFNIFGETLNIEWIFSIACNYEHIHIMEWLSSHFNILSSIEDEFVRYCVLNKLKTVKWLYSSGKFNCQITKNILYSLNNISIDVARWIFNIISIETIREDNDKLFILATKTINKIKILDLLCDKCGKEIYWSDKTDNTMMKYGIAETSLVVCFYADFDGMSIP